jgi:hypothetical protein
MSRYRDTRDSILAVVCAILMNKESGYDAVDGVILFSTSSNWALVPTQPHILGVAVNLLFKLK